MRTRALPLLTVVALAGCGSSHHAQSTRPRTPVLSTLLARGKSVHFVLAGTVKIDEESILSHLHQVAPFHVHARGDASRFGLHAVGAVDGEVSGTGTVVVAGHRAYGKTEGTWYDLGKVDSLAGLLRKSHWTGTRGVDGRLDRIDTGLHLSTQELEQLSGLSLPFGVDGADVKVTLYLSHWGEPVTIKRPSHAVPLPR